MGVNILRAETYLQYSGIGGTDRGPSIHFPTSAFGSYMRFEEITDKHVIVYSPRLDRRLPFYHSEASTPYGHRDKFGHHYSYPPDRKVSIFSKKRIPITNSTTKINRGYVLVSLQKYTLNYYPASFRLTMEIHIINKPVITKHYYYSW